MLVCLELYQVDEYESAHSTEIVIAFDFIMSALVDYSAFPAYVVAILIDYPLLNGLQAIRTGDWRIVPMQGTSWSLIEY